MVMKSARVYSHDPLCLLRIAERQVPDPVTLKDGTALAAGETVVGNRRAVLPRIVAAAIPAGVAVVDVDDGTRSRRSVLALTPTEPRGADRALVAALRTEAARIALSTPTAEHPDE